jgi:4-oxalocrotonate tautomerase family enzyme
VLGPALLAEYEDVLGRTDLFAASASSLKERNEVFDGFLNRCRWVEVFYAWRPNLPDEADNHLIELGVAAQAVAIVTRNLRDVSRGELKFPSMPFAHIHMIERRTGDQKHAVIEKVTQPLVEAVGAPKENVRAWITEVPKSAVGHRRRVCKRPGALTSR